MRKIPGILFITLLLFTTEEVQAQKCDCIDLQYLSKEKKDSSTITIRVKNRCDRRFYFNTKGFWIKVAGAENSTSNTSVMHKLEGSQPEYVLLKWSGEQLLTFKNDIGHAPANKIAISYANTNTYSTALFSPATVKCEKAVTMR